MIDDEKLAAIRDLNGVYDSFDRSKVWSSLTLEECRRRILKVIELFDCLNNPEPQISPCIYCGGKTNLIWDENQAYTMCDCGAEGKVFAIREEAIEKHNEIYDRLNPVMRHADDPRVKNTECDHVWHSDNCLFRSCIKCQYVPPSLPKRDPRYTKIPPESNPKEYRINFRRGGKYEVKPECEKIDGKIFKFWKCWKIEEGIYEGEFAMVPFDIPQQYFPCTWIASGDMFEEEKK